jgi:GNAT superfamily N-acetyltransferase
MTPKTRIGDSRAPTASAGNAATAGATFIIRPAKASDMTFVTAIDERITGIRKMAYWADVFERYSRQRAGERFFFVAAPPAKTAEQHVLGFIVGEVRAWEFGSAPCGWVFALSVDPSVRLHGVGEALFEQLSDAFRNAGVNKMRTMVAQDNRLHLLFFRGEGMMAGPYIQLEKDLG